MGLAVDLTESDCITCGVRFAMPTAMYKHQQEKGGYHHCPNGHKQGWSQDESLLAKARRERDTALQQIARAEDEARQAREQATRDVAKAKAETRRLKKRTAAGTCPCCQRTFSNMATHMKTQHPEFIADTGAKVVPIKRAV
jgi:hypothetical protein